jgi:acyl dehydratase
MIDRSRVGFATPPSRVPVDAWRVQLFCQAIGETDPTAWALGTPLPPTFLKAIEGEHFSSAALMQLMNVPLKGVLHAEQRFEHVGPVRIGDVVEVQRRVDRLFDKKDGALTFIVVDTEYRVQERRVATSTQTILVRNTIAS